MALPFVEALKSDPATHDIAVVFVTSHIDIEHEISSLTEGGIDFLRKPLHAASESDADQKSAGFKLL